MGYRQYAWKPPVGPLGPSLPATLLPLTAHTSSVIVAPGLTDLAMPAGANGVEAYGTLFYGRADARSTSTYREPNGPTVDQVVAASLRSPSIAMGVQVDLTPHSSTAAGATACFWRGPGQPISPALDPVRIYADLFSSPFNGPIDITAAKRLLLERSSILDYVGTSLDRFGRRLGTEDRQVIAGHFQAIRDLELQLGGLDQGTACGIVAPGMLDLGDHNQYPAILRAQMGLLVAALKCGLTLVATWQLSDAAGMNVNVGFIPGIPALGTGYQPSLATWYGLAHNPVLAGVDHKQIVDAWFMARFADLLAAMEAVGEPGGSLLDNSVVLWASNMEDGTNKNSQALPWMLAGRCGGYFKTGQCVASAGTPSTGVLSEICRAMGVAPDPFATPLPALRA
jgi:hypothetical protein